MSDPQHARIAGAAGFWKQYPIPVSFEEPCEIVGDVLELLDYKNPAGEHFPKLRILRKDGSVAIVIASQARLLAALCEHRPMVGERVRIRYMGEGERAAFGLNKTKEFTVEVRRPDPPPSERPDGRTSGEVNPLENAKKAGA